MTEKPEDSRGENSEQDQPPTEHRPQDGQQQGPPPGQTQNPPQGGQQQGPSPGQTQNPPQGGRPRPQGQAQPAPPQTGQVQTGLNVDTAYLQEWTVYLTALFAVGGAGLGVLWVLLDAVDTPVFTQDSPNSPEGGIGGGIEGSLETLAGASVATPTLIILILVLSVVAVFLGAWLGRTLQGPNQESFVIAGGSVAAGGSVFFLLVSLLLPVGFEGLSLDVGGLLVNLILTAIFLGAIAAGGAAVTRNLAPRDL